MKLSKFYELYFQSKRYSWNCRTSRRALKVKQLKLSNSLEAQPVNEPQDLKLSGKNFEEMVTLELIPEIEKNFPKGLEFILVV